MKNTKTLFILLLVATAFASCSKNDDGSEALKPTGTPVIEHTITVSNVDGPNNVLDPNRAGYINLYDGLVYTQIQAKSNSARVDIVYKYRVLGGPQYYRAFFDMPIQAAAYVEGFGTITQSKVISVENNFSISKTAFANIKTTADIDALLAGKDILKYYAGYAYASDSKDNVSNTIFSFIDKNGKKGFFSIDPYTPRVAQGSAAPLTLHIKVQP
jgi:hypothetical protein